MDLERTVHDLTERVSALEAAIDAQSARLSEVMADRPSRSLAPPPPGARPVTPPPPDPVTYPPPSVGMAAQPPPPVPVAAQPKPAFSFEWGIESILRWAGVGLVTLAAIFLVSTAVSRGWIGPELQLLGAAVGGLALLGGALWLADTRSSWALALGSGGSIVVIASSLATHEWLDLVGPGPAVALAAVAALASVAVAVWTRIEGIALVAAVVAMMSTPETLDAFGDGAILGWVAAIVLASTALGLAMRWPGLRLITGWLGAFVLMVYALSEEAEGALQVAGFVGAALIGTALWLAPTIAHRLAPSEGSGRWRDFDWTPIDLRLVALVPFWVWGVVVGLLEFENGKHDGLIAIVTAVAFMGLAELTFGRVERTVSLTTFLGAFSLLAVGFAVYFEGPALMVALAGHAITSYLLSRKLSDTPLQGASYVAGFAASLLAVIEMGEAIELEGFPNLGHALAPAVVVLCWIAAAALVYRRRDEAVPFELPFLGAWIGSMLWLAAALIAAPQGLMLISAAWTAMACAGLIIGLTRRQSVVKNAALGTLVLTLGKLVTVDLAEIDVFWRVGLFFVVGTGLIALGLKVPGLVGRAAESDEEVEEAHVTTF